jgi:hypothetical protein
VEEPERCPALEDKSLLAVMSRDERNDVSEDVVALDNTRVDAIPARDLRDLSLGSH